MKFNLQRKVNPLFALSLLMLTVVAIAIPENYLAERSTKPKAVLWENGDCLKCHNNVSTIKKMRDKSGNPNELAAELELARRAGHLSIKSKTY